MKAKFAVTLLGALLMVLLGCIPAAAHHLSENNDVFTAARLKKVDCGIQSLAYLLKVEGKDSASNTIHGMLPSSQLGSSIRDLIELSRTNGVDLRAYSKGYSSIDSIPVPVIVHLRPEKNSSTGHYAILENVGDNIVFLYDAQQNRLLRLPEASLNQRWSGIFLGTSDSAMGKFQEVSEQVTKATYGGTCGTVQLEVASGENGGKPKCNKQK